MKRSGEGETQDQQILRRMKLSEEDLQDLFNKLNQFFDSLNPRQRRAYRNSQQSIDHAARELGDDITAEELEAFLRKHAPKRGIICVVCAHGGPGGRL